MEVQIAPTNIQKGCALSMELLQLTYFCDAAETESFSRTARNYHVSPANISNCIRSLEEELSTKLFDRRGSRISLNEDGRWFYEQVSKALALLDDAKKEATCDLL